MMSQMKQIQKALVRTLYPRGAVRRVLCGSLRGLKFRVVPSMGATYALGYDGYQYDVLVPYIRKGGFVIDVGANAGQVTLLLSRRVGQDGRVMSIEPVPENARFLRENLRLNRITNVTVCECACADQEGTVIMEINTDSLTQCKVESVEPDYVVHGSGRVEVRTATLDCLCREIGHMPDFVKIDVEGSAGLVIRGASEILSQARTVFYVEFHGNEERIEIERAFEDSGYLISTVNGQRVDSITREQSPWVVCVPPSAIH